MKHHLVGSIPEAISSLQSVLENSASKIIIEVMKGEVEQAEDLLSIIRDQVGRRIRCIDWFRNKREILAFTSSLNPVWNMRMEIGQYELDWLGGISTDLMCRVCW